MEKRIYTCPRKAFSSIVESKAHPDDESAEPPKWVFEESLDLDMPDFGTNLDSFVHQNQHDECYTTQPRTLALDHTTFGQTPSFILEDWPTSEVSEDVDEHFAPEELRNLEGTSSMAVRNMSKRERMLVLHKRKLRNRMSARRSRERRLQLLNFFRAEMDKAYVRISDFTDFFLSIYDGNLSDSCSPSLYATNV